MTSDQTRGGVYGRIFIIDDEVVNAQFWCQELEPMTYDKRGTAEWAKDHFDCYSVEDLRDMFELPQGAEVI